MTPLLTPGTRLWWTAAAHLRRAGSGTVRSIHGRGKDATMVVDRDGGGVWIMCATLPDGWHLGERPAPVEHGAQMVLEWGVG